MSRALAQVTRPGGKNGDLGKALSKISFCFVLFCFLNIQRDYVRNTNPVGKDLCIKVQHIKLKRTELFEFSGIFSWV